MSLRCLFAALFLAGLARAAEPKIVHGLKAEIYSDGAFNNLVATRIDPNIDFHWSLAHPSPEAPADHFSIRWTGWIKAPRRAV